MLTLIRQIRRHGPFWAAFVYSAVALVLVGATWAVVVEIAGMNALYVRVVVVGALLCFPLVVGLAWAIREPADPAGKGHVVRD